MSVPWWLVLLAGVVTVAAYVLVERSVRRFLERVTGGAPLIGAEDEYQLRIAPMMAGLFVAMAVLLQFGFYALRQQPRFPPGASVSSRELHELRNAVDECCRRQKSFVPPEPDIFGGTGSEVAIILTAAFAVLAVVVLRRGHKKTAAALFAASTLFGLTGTTLFSIDKAVSLDKVDKLFGVQINSASLIGPQEPGGPGAVPADVTVEEAEIEAFATGEDELPALGTAVPPALRVRNPLLLVLIGRADRRELRGELRVRHGTNPRLAQRRAETVARELWPAARAVIFTAPPRISDVQATEKDLAPDRSVKIYAFFARQ